MIRVAKRGNTIVAVEVRKSTPKEMRLGVPQYVAFAGLHTPGGGDSIEEAVDAVSEQLPVS
jgi:hypothetical protein